LNAPLKTAPPETIGSEAAVEATPYPRSGGEFGGLVRRLWRTLKYASWGMIAVSAVVIFREVKAIFDAAYETHPALGWAFLALVLVLLWIGVVRPIRRYWAIPAAVKPPRDGRLEHAGAAEVARRARFLVKVADNLARNPRLSAIVPEILLARVEAERLEASALSPAARPEELKKELRTLEAVRFDSIFKPLDVEANQVIRGEALAVGLGTAVSMNGTFDAWIVLWRNLSLVSKLAAVYYGRPGIRGTLFVMRDVATAMLLASKLQGAVGGAAGFFGSWLGNTGSALLGPVADGAVNALVTVRIGYVAKARCRSFRVWTDSSLKTVLAGCFKEAASHGKGVVFDVMRGAKGGLRKVSGEVWQKTTGLVARFFARPPQPPAEPA
jgi:putative membrane protein